MKSRPDKKQYQIDMSPEAIDRRLRELGQLYKLGMEIQKAKHIGKVKDYIQQGKVPVTFSPIT